MGAFLCVLLLGGVLRGQGGAGNAGKTDNVVLMNTFEVSAKANRYHWRYSRSAHFEILCSLDELDLVSRIVWETEQIISLLERNSPIFAMRRELPAKVIFIQDQGIERFFTDNVKSYNPDDFDSPAFGVNGLASRGLHQVSARCDSNDEQVVFVKLITQKFLESKLSEHHKVHENSVDLAISYLQSALGMNTNLATAAWLSDVLNAFRGHSPGGPDRLPWAINSETYAYYQNHSFVRPGWLDINRDNISIGRYCLACETGNIMRTKAYAKLNAKQQADFWAGFMSHPYLSLGDVLATDAYGRIPDPNSLEEIERQFVLRRELRDFVFYCIFGADLKMRLSFVSLVRQLKNKPMSEELFRQCFGMGYDETQAKIYAVYNGFTRNSPEYENSPWGAQRLVVSKFVPESVPDAPGFKDARRAVSARIISDWFAIAGLNELARRTLLNSSMDMSAADLADSDYNAALGIAEAALGNDSDALVALEKATAAGVKRPQAYRELARLRLANILKSKGNDHRLDVEEIEDVSQPLFFVMRNMPMTNQKTYLQSMEVWGHTDEKFPDEMIARLMNASRYFIDYSNDITLLEKAAVFLSARGYYDDAKQLIDYAEQKQNNFTSDERARLDSLKTGLSERTAP